jgi:hypothetical protein
MLRLPFVTAPGAVALAALLAGCGPTEQIHGAHDSTAPTVSVGGISGGETVIDPRGVVAVAHDSESTIAHMIVYLDGSEVYRESFASYEVSIPFTILTGRENAGTHELFVRATDAAGNVGEIAVSYTVFAP